MEDNLAESCNQCRPNLGNYPVVIFSIYEILGSNLIAVNILKKKKKENKRNCLRLTGKQKVILNLTHKMMKQREKKRKIMYLKEDRRSSLHP